MRIVEARLLGSARRQGWALPQPWPAPTASPRLVLPGCAELALGALRAEHHHRRRLIVRPQTPPTQTELALSAAFPALEHALNFGRVWHGQDAAHRSWGCLVARTAMAETWTLSRSKDKMLTRRA